MAKNKGFTLIELAAALVIAGFVLAAAMTLGSAMGRGNDAVAKMGRNQAVVRYTAVQLAEEIRNGIFAVRTDGGNVVVWKEDANGDYGMNGNELVYIVGDTTGKVITVARFGQAADAVSLADVVSGAAKSGLFASTGAVETDVVKGCGGIELAVRDNKLVTVRFQLTEETGSREYEVCAAVGGSAHGWLDGGAFAADDD